MHRFRSIVCNLLFIPLAFLLSIEAGYSQSSKDVNSLIVTAQPSFPVSVTGGNFTFADGRGIVYADIAIHPLKSKVKSATLTLLQIRAGKVKAGQAFTIDEPRAASPYQLLPFFSLADGDKIAAFVSDINCSTRRYQLGAEDYNFKLASLLDAANSESSTLLPSANSESSAVSLRSSLVSNPKGTFPQLGGGAKPPITDAIDCDIALNRAVGACIPGVKSFTCNNKSYSFTCK